MSKNSDLKLGSESMSRGNDPSLLKGQEQKVLNRDIKKSELKDISFKSSDLKEKDFSSMEKKEFSGKDSGLSKEKDLSLGSQEGRSV